MVIENNEIEEDGINQGLNYLHYRLASLDQLDSATILAYSIGMQECASSNTFTTSKVKLYPNPTSNVLNIESLGTIQTISVYNVLGQEVINKELNSTSTALDVSSLNSGIYVVKTNVDGVTSSTKFIKQQLITI